MQQTFQYQYKDRPLEGYTIERAAGRGGFGEVYYALSDGGRQVALKAVQNYEQIELRGIRQCMNLKNPHLVTIFDVKYNEQQKPFVIMEYVSGPSLRDIIDESPSGIGEQKTAFFLREIAKGLSYLHDHGIVHRDLKPGNIFYENGYVKIGDYGLSKAIQTGANSNQTITVGTVHYMAPEIGAGCYDSSIDIYAMGILIYEMLTGQVPYFGSSPTEVLMKHMSNKPDLTNIPEPFKKVITKALEKDPKDRYQNIQEMVEDVFGTEHIRNSVSHFSPDSLSIIAENIGHKIATPPDPSDNINQDKPKESPKPKLKNKPVINIPDLRTAIQYDPLEISQRLFLYAITLILVSIGSAAFVGFQSWMFTFWEYTFPIFIATSMGIFLSRWFLFKQLEQESNWLNNIITGGAGAVLGIMVGFAGINYTSADINESFFPISIVLLMTNWHKHTNPLRDERVSLGLSIGKGFFGFIAASIFTTDAIFTASILAGTTLLVQVSSPYIPKSLRKKYKNYSINTKPVKEIPKHKQPNYNNLNISPFKRLWALLLCGGSFLGICGLQRFYVGKYVTGILWLITFGFLGLGQIIDAIFIIFGNFRDFRDLPLKVWESDSEIASMNLRHPTPKKDRPYDSPLDSHQKADAFNDNTDREGYVALKENTFPAKPQEHTSQLSLNSLNPFPMLLAIVGYFFIFIGFVIGMLVACKIPHLLAGDYSANREMTKLFQSDNWANILSSMGLILTSMLLLIATICLLISRRRHGIKHMLRAIMGIVGITIIFVLTSDTIGLYQIERILESRKRNSIAIGQYLEVFTNDVFIPVTVLIIITIMIFAWPPKQLSTKSSHMGE